MLGVSDLECAEAILRHADYVGSTAGILKYAETSPAKEFIVATESGLLHQMEKTCPGKTFIVPPRGKPLLVQRVSAMKRNTMEKLHLRMRDRAPEVTINEELRVKAPVLIARGILHVSKDAR
jgi:quinolinate synthase